MSIPILYGTESGNSEYCADMLETALNAEDFQSKAINMEDFEPSDIETETLVFIITSTYGNGDPPDNAIDFLHYLETESLDLSALSFAVCALGDSSFPKFAQCGKDFESALLKQSASLVFNRVDCDCDFELPFESFKESALQYMRKNKETSQESSTERSTRSSVSTSSKSSAYSRDNPFLARLHSKKLLSKTGSNKETMHYEIDISTSEISYEVGDCFGIHPSNSDSDVIQTLQALKKTGSELVYWNNQQTSLFSTLKHCCLQHVGLGFLRYISEANPNPQLVQILAGPEAQLQDYMQTRHVLDVLLENITDNLEEQTLVNTLRKLQPRLYSIASSPTKNPNRVAFTIETVRYQKNNRKIEGVASCWLADRLQNTEEIPLYVMKNASFHFPKDNTPVIMIGPGTGIAPFRAYLEEVEAAGINNSTWLFFGHQHQQYDFLYEEELTRWLQSGVLNKINFAWSRDQAEKIYVQNRIMQNGSEIWKWIEKGARIYVCGDAKNMAPAVAKAFSFLSVAYGRKSDGQRWLQLMIEQGRYRSDVY